MKNNVTAKSTAFRCNIFLTQKIYYYLFKNSKRQLLPRAAPLVGCTALHQDILLFLVLVRRTVLKEQYNTTRTTNNKTVLKVLKEQYNTRRTTTIKEQYKNRSSTQQNAEQIVLSFLSHYRRFSLVT